MIDKKVYSITLTDGTVIDNLTLNGNNFVSQIPIDKHIFDANCYFVTISDGESERAFENMECVQVTQMGEAYWFVLRELSETELAARRNRSDIEYIALMCDVEL